MVILKTVGVPSVEDTLKLTSLSDVDVATANVEVTFPLDPHANAPIMSFPTVFGVDVERLSSRMVDVPVSLEQNTLVNVTFVANLC